MKPAVCSRSPFASLALASLVVMLPSVACAPPAPDAPDPVLGDDDDEDDIDTRALPPFFRLRADAQAEAGAFTTSCLLDWHFELRAEAERTDDVLAMTGIAGGEASREFLDDTGAGVALRADSFAEITVTWTQPDAFVIDVPINETAIERFWRNLVRLEGTIAADGQTASGTWTCGPMDVEQGGIVDDTVFAPGTWTTTPENIEPEP